MFLHVICFPNYILRFFVHIINNCFFYIDPVSYDIVTLQKKCPSRFFVKPLELFRSYECIPEIVCICSLAADPHAQHILNAY